VRSVIVLSLAVAALGLAAPVQAATKSNRYSPWNSNGDPEVRRYFHGSGECTQASRVNPRKEAWRCISGNITLDPCFQSPTDDEVLCVSSPWALQGHLLSATLDPDAHGNSRAPGPWALRVGRYRCTFIRRPAKRRASYRCGRSRRGPFLFGLPNTKRKTWTIRFARNKRGRRAKRVRVRTAYL
jgi:hypothetical protein